MGFLFLSFLTLNETYYSSYSPYESVSKHVSCFEKTDENKLQKTIDGVVVYSLSRLGRKLTDVIGWIELLSKKNIDFISIKENFNVNEIYGKLMLNILGSLNEFEVNVLGERIKDVKQYKKSKNEVYCGDILFGMYKRNGKLVKNNYELKTLKLIKNLREKQSLSYNKISEYLNDKGILSKNKCKWYSNSVSSVYNNGVIQKYL